MPLVVIGALMLSAGITALWFGTLGRYLPESKSSQIDDYPARKAGALKRSSPNQLRYGARISIIGLLVLLAGIGLTAR